MKKLTVALGLILSLNSFAGTVVEQVTMGKISGITKVTDTKVELSVDLELSRCHAKIVDKPLYYLYDGENGKLNITIDAVSEYSNEDIQCIRDNIRTIKVDIENSKNYKGFNIGFLK